MSVMGVDVKTAGNAENSLGPHDACIEAAPGDEVVVDLTATGIPASGGIIGFEAYIHFPDVWFTVTSVDYEFLMSTGPNSVVAHAGGPVPDLSVDGEFRAAAVDTSGFADVVTGVLSRLTIQVEPGAAPGQHALILGESKHIDWTNESYDPVVKKNAYIAVGVPCDLDFDGVPDDEDGCPTYPGIPEQDGCPPAGASAVGGIAGLLDDSQAAPSDAAEGPGLRLPYLALAALSTISAAALIWWALRPRRNA
jgi:hypothetical protein